MTTELASTTTVTQTTEHPAVVTPLRRRPVAGQDFRTSLPLILSDCLGLALACALTGLAAVAWYGAGPMPWEVWLGVSFAMLIGFFAMGLYPGVGLHPAAELRAMTKASSVVCAGAIASSALNTSAIASLGCLLLTAVGILITPALRLAVRRVCGQFDWWCQPALIFGRGREVQRMVAAMERNRRSGLRPIKAEFDADELTDSMDRELPVVVRRIAAAHGVRHAVLSSNSLMASTLSRSEMGIGMARTHLLLDMGELPCLWAQAGSLGGTAEFRFHDQLLSPMAVALKRAVDLTICLCCAPLLLPLVVAIATLIKLTSPGPIFYSQRRRGLGGRSFSAWKFRTMVQNADAVLHHHLAEDGGLREEWERDHKLKRDPRVTRVGRLLRKASLDEIPQLWNVVCGEMSLVGPRPIVDNEIAKYGETYRHYERVKPGITGLWQVSGRNNTSYEQRLAYDRFYVRNWSLWLDVYILMRTIKTVVFQEGAY